MDTVIYVEEPTVTYNNPTADTDDAVNWYCSFLTKETGQPDSFSGTQVYYKIYNNWETLKSKRDSIISLNSNSSSNSSAAVNRLISDGYQTLLIENSNATVFVPATGSNRKVVFRIKTIPGSEDYSGDNPEQFKACVLIADVEKGKPCRYVEKSSVHMSFDFFDDEDTDLDTHVVPVGGDDGDSDYCDGTADSEDKYYVQFFAVGVAFDGVSQSEAYSQVLNLGSLPVIKGK